MPVASRQSAVGWQLGSVQFWLAVGECAVLVRSGTANENCKLPNCQPTADCRLTTADWQYHHTRQTGWATIFAVGAQLNAFANSGMFETTPLVR